MKLLNQILAVKKIKDKIMPWISVKDRLPGIDQYVLWLHESGYIFYDAIDKDWDSEYLDYFLGGYGNKEISGPITHWMLPELPVAFNTDANLIHPLEL